MIEQANDRMDRTDGRTDERRNEQTDGSDGRRNEQNINLTYQEIMQKLTPKIQENYNGKLKKKLYHMICYNLYLKL